MEFRLLNDIDYFSMKISNIEGNIRTTPSRAFKRINSQYDNSYFTEILTSVRHDNLKGQINYDLFDRNIERKIKNNENNQNINILTFFGDKETDISEISKFEDIGLIDNFEKLFNDNLISMPYALSLYNKNNYDTIYSQIKTSYDEFATSVNTKNIFCYLPVYIDYKKIRDFLNFYSDKDLGTVYHSGGTYNAIPVYADFKRSNPDAFKRSVAILQKLKKEFIKEGFYPIYYAANISRPRLSDKKHNVIAKEFMLSFLGFDIIGTSMAYQPREGNGYPQNNKYLNFDLNTFNYFYKNNDKIKKKEADINKAQVLDAQTNYLNNTMTKSSPTNELNKRPEAKKYIQTYG